MFSGRITQCAAVKTTTFSVRSACEPDTHAFGIWEGIGVNVKKAVASIAHFHLLKRVPHTAKTGESLRSTSTCMMIGLTECRPRPGLSFSFRFHICVKFRRQRRRGVSGTRQGDALGVYGFLGDLVTFKRKKSRY